MGQNSTEVAYGFGQMGSAYSDLAQTIVPPEGMVINAIQFLNDNTPTVLTPELLGTASGTTNPFGGGTGPGFPEITGGSNVTGLNSTHTRNSTGIFMASVTNSGASSQVTLDNSFSMDLAKLKPIQVGMYVLLVNSDYQEDGNPAMVIDSETPIPIYSGPNQQGVKVVSIDADDTITLSAPISPSSQSLIFLGPQQGAGGIIANGQVYPRGITIYGRWTAFKGEAGSGVICYFGK